MTRDKRKEPAHAMPTVPRSKQLGKCTACGAFKRLLDMAGGVCAGPCQQIVIEPEHIKPEVPTDGILVSSPRDLVECPVCGEWDEPGVHVSHD